MSNKRIKYNTPINFPASFTLRELRKATHHKIKYITVYSRVQKGLGNGTIVATGLKTPDKNRRGRKEIVYQLVSAPEPTVAAGASTESVW